MRFVNNNIERKFIKNYLFLMFIKGERFNKQFLHMKIKIVNKYFCLKLVFIN